MQPREADLEYIPNCAIDHQALEFAAVPDRSCQSWLSGIRSKGYQLVSANAELEKLLRHMIYIIP